MLIFRTVCVTVRGKKSVFRLANEFAREGGECSHLTQKIGRTHSRKVSRDSTIFSHDGRSIQTIRINWNYSSYSIRQGTFPSVERRSRRPLDSSSLSFCTFPRFESRIDRAMRDSPKIHLHTSYRKRVTR